MKMVYLTVTIRMSRAVLLFLTLTICVGAADIRLGIIGTDVSHVIHFTRILNNANDPEHILGAKVVAAYKSSSPDIESSRTRVEAFTAQLQKEYGVELVPDIETLCSKVDGVLIESGDGRVHLAQAKLVFAAH